MNETYLIVGLGNPGKKYEQTRHNAGFIMIDRLAIALKIKIKKKKSETLIGEGNFEGTKVVLAKPLTFMNLSGQSVQKLCKWYKISPENVIVIYDDVYIKMGEIRTRLNGSSGGHNGIQNIIDCLETEGIPRIRIGIGPIPEDNELHDFVLDRLSRDELKILDDAYRQVIEGVKKILAHG